MSSLALSAVPKTTNIFHKKRVRYSHRRPVTVRAGIDPNLVNYAQVQIVTWILPLTIAGRLVGVDYKEIGTVTLFATLAKTFYDLH